MATERAQGDRDGEGVRRPWAEVEDVELVSAMRAGESAALDEFILRFGRLLFDRARRLGIARSRSEDVIARVIEGVGQRLAAGELQIRSSVPAYLVRCFLREYARGEKTEQKRSRLLRERTIDVAGNGERVVQGLCSEYAIAASRGQDWEPPMISLAVERLASMIEDELTEEEERLLAWMSNEVDVSTIAREFGLKYDTLAKRIRRLRARMRTAALRHAEHFALEDRRALVKFFTRADQAYEAAALSATIDRPPSSAASVADPVSRKDQ